MVRALRSFDDFCPLDYISEKLRYDVIFMRLPVPQTILNAEPSDSWPNLDEIQNIFRMDMLAESPGFILLGCGSSIKGLQMGRKLLS